MELILPAFVEKVQLDKIFYLLLRILKHCCRKNRTLVFLFCRYVASEVCVITTATYNIYTLDHGMHLLRDASENYIAHSIDFLGLFQYPFSYRKINLSTGSINFGM